MTSDELKRLGDQEIIIASGSPPVLTDKIKYYENDFFLKKLCNAPAVSDVIRDPDVYPEYNNYPARKALIEKTRKEHNKKFGLDNPFKAYDFNKTKEGESK